jgi:hypothetical protein
MRARSRTRVDDNGYLANPLGVVGLTQAGRGRLIAQQATSAYYARDGGGQVVQDRNNGAIATVGSVGGAKIVSDGLYLPGAAGNYASTPDAAALDITGDIDIRTKVALVDWTPTANNYILSKYSAVDGNRSFYFRINASNGYPTVGWSDDGTGAGIRTIAATAAPTVSDGDSIHLRVTVDVDNDATGTDVNFYTSSNGSSWTQLGTTVTTAGTHAIYAGTADVLAGCLYNGVQHLDGTITSVEVRDGIDGTVVASPNFAAQPSNTTSFDDAQGNTWTVTDSGDITNDPTFLDHDGTDYAWFPGTTGNNAEQDLTGTSLTNYEVRIDVEHEDWRPAAPSRIFSERWGVVRFTSTSFLFYKYNGGYTFVDLFSATQTLLTGRHQIRLVVDTNADTVDLYVRDPSQALDTGSWGTATTFTSAFGNTDPLVPAVAPATTPVAVGSTSGGAEPLLGSVYDFYLTDGATTYFRFNPSDLTGWTVNRSTTGLKTAVVTRPVYLFDGTDDYLQLPDTPTFTATTGKHTVLVAFRQFGTDLDWLWSSESATDDGFILYAGDPGVYARVGGTTATVNTAPVDYVAGSEIIVAAMVADDGTVYGYSNETGLSAGVSYASVGTIPHGAPRVGTRAHTLSFQYTGEIFATLSFPGVALTETELDDLSAYLLAGASA